MGYDGNLGNLRVFTLQSIKSRIETSLVKWELEYPLTFLLYSPLNQGLKLKLSRKGKASNDVFTLQSIKSRIETKL